jgi:hypothetical protein
VGEDRLPPGLWRSVRPPRRAATRAVGTHPATREGMRAERCWSTDRQPWRCLDELGLGQRLAQHLPLGLRQRRELLAHCRFATIALQGRDLVDVERPRTAPASRPSDPAVAFRAREGLRRVRHASGGFRRRSQRRARPAPSLAQQSTVPESRESRGTRMSCSLPVIVFATLRASRIDRHASGWRPLSR